MKILIFFFFFKSFNLIVLTGLIYKKNERLFKVYIELNYKAMELEAKKFSSKSNQKTLHDKGRRMAFDRTKREHKVKPSL